ARPPPLLLEEREVGARAAAAGGGRTGVLGDERVPQLRRSMAGTAVLGRLTWQIADVVDVVTETARVKTIVFDVPGWAGHRAGQHVDVRLTAEDGYQAQRSTRSLRRRRTSTSCSRASGSRTARSRPTSRTSSQGGTSASCAARRVATSCGRP